MIEKFKIKIVDPPEKIKFPLKRKVLFEKFDKGVNFSVTKLFEHYKNTILLPGEHIYIVDTNSLQIERYTISAAAITLGDINDKFTKYIYLYDNKGDLRGVGIPLHSYLTRINTAISTHLSARHIYGEKLICSSEENILIVLKNYLPILIKKIEDNIGKKNTSANRLIGKQARWKKLRKLHRELSEYLKNN